MYIDTQQQPSSISYLFHIYEAQQFSLHFQLRRLQQLAPAGRVPGPLRQAQPDGRQRRQQRGGVQAWDRGGPGRWWGKSWKNTVSFAMGIPEKPWKSQGKAMGNLEKAAGEGRNLRVDT